MVNREWIVDVYTACVEVISVGNGELKAAYCIARVNQFPKRSEFTEL